MSGTPPGLFKGTVPFYAKYRSAYPASLIHRVARICGLSRESRVLDLGCGPGILARAFAPLCSEVVGVDPEPDMITAAEQYLTGCGGTSRFVCASAHELSANIGSFWIVVIGRAFHWMDRAATLDMLDTIVDPEGAVVLFRDPALKLPENNWREAFDRVFDQFASTEAARLGAQKTHSAIDEWYLLRSKFSSLERTSVIRVRKLSMEQIIGRAHSMAGTSPEDLGERRAEFEHAMREAVSPFARDGNLIEITEPQALIARRAGS